MKNRRSPGFALIATLITLVLLTIVLTAFLSSALIERATARAYVSKTKAELAAEAAVTAAVVTLRDNFKLYPDSATVWETPAQGLTTEGTVLYYRDRRNDPQPDPLSKPLAPTAPTYVLPLVSGATAQVIANRSAGLPATLDATNSFDFNHKTSATDTEGWIGRAPGSTLKEFRAPWVELKDDAGNVVSRYAFWVEDESFRVNLNTAGKTPRGSTSLGASPSELPLQGALKQITLPGSLTADAVANLITTQRAEYPGGKFLEPRAANQLYGPAGPNASAQLGDKLGFLSTIVSKSSNLSRHGSHRVNLNEIILNSDGTAKTPLSAAAGPGIRAELDKIIAAIRYHIPDFGERFYRTDPANLNSDQVSPANREIYLEKVAANIRDYIDPDSQPTIVNNDAGRTINIGTAPTLAIGPLGGGTDGPNSVVAIGKENVPFLQESMLRVKQLEFSNRLGTSSTYKIEIDHYLEFWNMGTKDITPSDLGPGAFLRIANPFGWDSGGGTDIPGRFATTATRDFSVLLSDIPGLIFEAGQATVITTDTAPLPVSFASIPGYTPGNLHRAPVEDKFRIFSGTTSKKSGSQLRLGMQTSELSSPNASSGWDAETEYILGNDLGTIESMYCGNYVSIISVNRDLPNETEKFNTDSFHFRGGSLKGNSASEPSQQGDPRTNMEQLFLTVATGTDTSRYLTAGNTSGNPPGTNTFTSLSSTYVKPATWADPATDNATAAYAPAFVANEKLISVAQLGDVFDPARQVTPGSTPEKSRGGGRTLRIGQPDDLYGPKVEDNASRERAAWRLLDLFTTNSNIEMGGVVNVNGLRRDNGAALRAALHEFAFRPTPNSDPVLAGKPLSDAAIDELISQARGWLDAKTGSALTRGAFRERGELSELAYFNSGTTAGADMSKALDRGREELFRRLAELITTRGNVFTVYAVGQALSPTINGTQQVLSTQQSRVTFELVPVFDPALPTTWDKTTVATRFKAPARYDVKILQELY